MFLILDSYTNMAQQTAGASGHVTQSLTAACRSVVKSSYLTHTRCTYSLMHNHLQSASSRLQFFQIHHTWPISFLVFRSSHYASGALDLPFEISFLLALSLSAVHFSG